MKFIFTLYFVVLSICLCSLVTAAPKRQKRALALEKCPENATREDCLAFAAEKSETMDYCHRFIVGGRFIEWQSCGLIMCGPNTILVDEDLSKPYPQCCKRCDVVDDEEPVVISGAL